jgi:hypothetical protein
MNNWYIVDQLAAGRRADLDREAAGGHRIHASCLANGGSISGNQSGEEPVSRRTGSSFLAELWSVLAVLARRSRHPAAPIAGPARLSALGEDARP